MQGLLEGVSQSFTTNFHFMDSVKAYLSYALLRASVSSSAVVFQVTNLILFVTNSPVIDFVTLLYLLILSQFLCICMLPKLKLYMKFCGNLSHCLICARRYWLLLNLMQYATGIFAVLLLRFRESLKVFYYNGVISISLMFVLEKTTSPLFLLIVYKILCYFFQGEIGVFFPLIILKSLESNELAQRTSVLRWFVSFLSYYVPSLQWCLCSFYLSLMIKIFNFVLF